MAIMAHIRKIRVPRVWSLLVLFHLLRFCFFVVSRFISFSLDILLLLRLWRGQLLELED